MVVGHQLPHRRTNSEKHAWKFMNRAESQKVRLGIVPEFASYFFLLLLVRKLEAAMEKCYVTKLHSVQVRSLFPDSSSRVLSPTQHGLQPTYHHSPS